MNELWKKELLLKAMDENALVVRHDGGKRMQIQKMFFENIFVDVISGTCRVQARTGAVVRILMTMRLPQLYRPTGSLFWQLPCLSDSG